MSHPIQIRNGDEIPDVADPLHRTGPQEQMDSIFIRIHRLLRGRYLWAIAIGTVLGAIGGFAGFKATKPLWTCTGTVQIKTSRDVVLSSSPENQQSQSPEIIKETQIALMRQQRMITMAMGKPEWQRLGRPLTDESIAEFMKKLTILPVGRSEMISVAFVDPDPAAASAAVNGILTAYNGVYVEAEQKAESNKKVALDGHRARLSGDRQSKLSEIAVLSRKFVGADDLRSMHQSSVADLSKLQSTINDLELTIGALEVGRPTTQPARKDPSKMKITEIAEVDGVMRELCRDQARLERDAALKLRNLGPNNPRYLEATMLLDLKKQEVESWAKEWKDGVAAAMVDPVRPAEGAPLTLEQLKVRHHKLTEDREKLEQKTIEMGRTMLNIEKLKRELADIEISLAETDRRLTQLSMEQKPADRITVNSFGERPIMTKDSRAAYTAAGAIGGLGMGFAIMMLLGVMDRSLRSPEDARKTARMPLLGILPNLPDDLADPEQAAIAAHCVHQIRTLLQLGGGRDKRIFAITSPAAGTGKTSLTLSLGVSFAASNCRTLIIDCDLIGGGLTARVDTIVRRKIGDILLRHNVISETQLAAALKHAESSGKRVGESLLELGYVKQSDIDHALHMQHEDPVGMLDAIEGEKLLDCVAETGIERLAILPLGAAMPTDVSRLSPAIVRSILDQARANFDIVLIDTGPVPGSLEASVAAAAADGVVLVVSRGEHRPMAERSIQHLIDIGANLAGMVFNRAQGRDMDLATTTKRLSSFDRRGMRSVSAQRNIQQDQTRGMGPMALAVTNKAPHGASGTRPRS